MLFKTSRSLSHPREIQVHPGIVVLCFRYHLVSGIRGQFFFPLLFTTIKKCCGGDEVEEEDEV